MKFKIHTDTKLDIKQTTKIYTEYYAKELSKKLIQLASQGIDKLDYYIVNH